MTASEFRSGPAPFSPSQGGVAWSDAKAGGVVMRQPLVVVSVMGYNLFRFRKVAMAGWQPQPLRRCFMGRNGSHKAAGYREAQRDFSTPAAAFPP